VNVTRFLIISAVVLVPLTAGAQLPDPAPAAEPETPVVERGQDPFAAYPALASPDAAARQRDVVALGRRRDVDALGALSTVLSIDLEPEVRARAAWALGRLGDPAASPALVMAAREEGSRRVRRAATLALATASDDAGKAALLELVQDKDSQVAGAACEALGSVDTEASRAALLKASEDRRPLVALTARRALARLPRSGGEPASATGATPQLTPPKLAAPRSGGWCTDGRTPPDCTYKRDRSDGASGRGVFILGGGVLGGLGGAFALDALRPYRQGVRVNPKRTLPADNAPSPLERAILGSMGAAVGAGTAAAWTLIDDVTMARASLIGLMALEGAAVGAASSIAFARPRNAVLLSSLGLGIAGAIGATAATFIPHDFGYGDVAFVWVNATLGFGAGALLMVALIPTGVGQDRGHLGYVRDIGDLFGGAQVFALPWGQVGRLDLIVASGLASSAVAALLTAVTLPLYEVGVTRALKTLGAAMLAAALVGIPPALLLPTPPLRLPSPERGAAVMAIGAGAVAGGVVFALSSNDDGQGPLIYIDRASLMPSKSKTEKKEGIALAPPTLGVVPPMPGSPNGGVYLGLVNARF